MPMAIDIEIFKNKMYPLHIYDDRNCNFMNLDYTNNGQMYFFSN